MLAKKLQIIILLTSIFLMPLNAMAGVITGTVPVHATVNAIYTLELTPSAINFAFGDPATQPILYAPVSYTAKYTGIGTQTVRLTIDAKTDLLSNSNKIPIGNLTFKKTSGNCPGYVATGNIPLAPQTANVLQTKGEVAAACTDNLNFALVNSYSYAVGTYQTTIEFSLVSP